MPRTIDDLALPLADMGSEGSQRNYLTRATGITPTLVDGWLDGARQRLYFWRGTEAGDFALYSGQLRALSDLRECGPNVFTLSPAPPKPRGPLEFGDYELPMHPVTSAGRRKAVKLIGVLESTGRLDAKEYDMSRVPTETRYDLIERIGAVLGC